MENLKYIYNQINDWVKIADQKALIFGSFNVVGFVYQLVNLNSQNNPNCYFYIVFLLSVISTLLAFYFWIRIIYPNLNNNSKKSKIFFLHIANNYENDIDAGIKTFETLDENNLKRDLSSQIVINAIIAKKKYRFIQNFVFAFCFQLLFLVILIVLQKI